MNDDKPFSIPAVRKLVRRVGILRVAFYFVAINVPIAVLLSAVVAWRGKDPGMAELVFRGVLSFVLFLAGEVLLVWLIHRAAKGKDPSRD